MSEVSDTIKLRIAFVITIDNYHKLNRQKGVSQKAAAPGAEELSVQYIYDLHDTVMLDICFSTSCIVSSS